VRVIGNTLAPNWAGQGCREGQSLCTTRGPQRRRQREEFTVRVSRCIVPEPKQPLPNNSAGRVNAGDSKRKRNANPGSGKQPKTSQSNSVFAPLLLARLFPPRALAGSRIITVARLSPMDTETPQSTPEEVGQAGKRQGRRERKKLKHEAQRNKPAPPPENSRFLARPWIKLPEINDAHIQHKVRVMTWNVCPAVPCT